MGCIASHVASVHPGPGCGPELERAYPINIQFRYAFMFEALCFEVTGLLDFFLTGIFETDDKLFVGLASGTLKVYQIDDSLSLSEPDTSSPKKESTGGSPVKLITSIEKFTKGSVDQLSGLEDARVLVALSNGYVYLYDLDTLALQERLHRTKGAVVFATSSELKFHSLFNYPPSTANDRRPSTADIQRSVSRLVVAAKKKLHCYEWQGAELIGSREISVSERPRSLTFIKPDKILCGLVVEYFLVDIPASTVSPIFAAGRPIGAIDNVLAGVAANIGNIASSASASARRQGCALATRLPEDESVVLVNEFSSAFLSADTGTFLKTKRPIKFRDVPAMLGYSYPFVISVTASSKRLEVRNPKTYTLLQQISFPTLQHLNDGKLPFVASSRQVWKLSLRPFEAQLDFLIEQNQLDEAVSLIEQLDDVFIEDRINKLKDLKMRKAELLFGKYKFSQSMTLFSEVSAPPERVLALYPPAISGMEYPNHKDGPTEEEPEGPEPKGEETTEQKKEEQPITGPAEGESSEKANGEIATDTNVLPPPVADMNATLPQAQGSIPIAADAISIADSTNAEAQRKRDLEIFDRFLRPTKSNSSSSKVDNSNAIGKGSRGADTSSLSDSLANFLSFGKASTTKTMRSGLGDPDFLGPESMDARTLAKAVRCLLIYLIDARRKISRLASVQSGTITKADLDLVSKESMTATAFGADLEREACVVDTALLRCYMLINPQLVGPLVRLANHCDKKVVREQLMMYGKWSELIDFYYAKKLHGDALGLLKQLSESKKTAFSGPEPTVQYLQKLGNENIDLVFEYAKEPIKINEQFGIDVSILKIGLFA